ncbi:MAG: ABC transporter ATP-binding protein [Bdellovibrionales bacterium]
MNQVLVEARKLVKSYAEKDVLSGVDLDLKQGECLAILGALGAGKTSLLRILSLVIPVDRGDIFIAGSNTREELGNSKSLIGSVFDIDLFEEEFSVFENLLLYSKFHNISAKDARDSIKKKMRLFEISQYSDRSIGELSPFELRCLSLCRALIHDPKVLILDSIFNGLDLLERNFLFDILSDLKKDGLSIVVSSDNVTDVRDLADRVAILADGKIKTVGSPADLIDEQIGEEVIEFLLREDEIEYTIRKIENQFEYRVSGNKVIVYLKQGQDSRQLLNFISSDGLSIRKAQLRDVVQKMELS